MSAERREHLVRVDAAASLHIGEPFVERRMKLGPLFVIKLVALAGGAANNEVKEGAFW
jgi:hypothetical protein